jgi:hypothetical protein
VTAAGGAAFAQQSDEAAAAAAAAAGGPPPRPSYPDSAEDTSCPRAELTALVDAYSAAMAAHDAPALPWAANVRFTENAEVLQPGDSTLWRGAGEWSQRNDLIDTQTCGTLSWGVIEEDGRLIHAAIRLATADGDEITEAEHILGREDEFAFGPEAVLELAWIDWETILNPLDRQSRGAMVAAANDYFSTFVETPSVNAPFADRCDRWENGAHTTPNHNCSPYGTRLYMTHPQRRFPVADLEAGIVAGFVYFNGALPDVHVFDMHRGRIQFIQAVIGPGAPDGGGVEAAEAETAAEGPNQ